LNPYRVFRNGSILFSSAHFVEKGEISYQDQHAPAYRKNVIPSTLKVVFTWKWPDSPCWSTQRSQSRHQ